MDRKEIRAIRKSVNAKAENGELRNALEKSGALNTRQMDAIVRRATRRLAVNGYVKDYGATAIALRKAGWPEDEIDFLIYRAASRIFK